MKKIFFVLLLASTLSSIGCSSKPDKGEQDTPPQTNKKKDGDSCTKSDECNDGSKCYVVTSSNGICAKTCDPNNSPTTCAKTDKCSEQDEKEGTTKINVCTTKTVDSECASLEECPSNLACVATSGPIGVCEQKCKSSRDCKDPRYPSCSNTILFGNSSNHTKVCGIIPGTGSSCFQDSDCAAGLACVSYVTENVSDYVCLPKCNSSSTCYQEFSECQNIETIEGHPVKACNIPPGQQQKLQPCHYNSDCATGLKCVLVTEGKENVNYLCLPDCADDTTCTDDPSRTSCRATQDVENNTINVCMVSANSRGQDDSCTLQDDCTTGLKCVMNSSITPYCTKPCSDDTDCSDFYACKDQIEFGLMSQIKACQTVIGKTCQKASDCKDTGNWKCVGGDKIRGCYPGCNSDVDCGKGTPFTVCRENLQEYPSSQKVSVCFQTVPDGFSCTRNEACESGKCINNGRAHEGECVSECTNADACQQKEKYLFEESSYVPTENCSSQEFPLFDNPSTQIHVCVQ